jgi:tetratricopeptide (TPR) repeat protein
MRHFLYFLLLFAIPAGSLAQRHKLTINAETPEGQLLQQIGQENDAAKKLALMEDFAGKYGTHEGAPWVLEQMVGAYLKANQFDKTIEIGEKLLATDPEDIGTCFNILKAAEGKKDAALVVKWAGSTSGLARKAAAAPKPEDEDEEEAWKNSVDYAKQVDTYIEYALYVTGVSTTDPNQTILLYETLEKQNPTSQHLASFVNQYFIALRQTNANDKAVALAEKTLETRQDNEDMLLTVADSYFNKKQNPDKVIAYGNRLAEVMGAKPKPEGVADADWEKRKNLLTGLGHWLAGITFSNQSRFADADKSLRQALPLVSDNDALKAQALFHLGLANYRMGTPKKDKKLMAEALKFNTQCAAIKSPFAAQAAKNAQVIRQQYGLR